MKVSIIESFYVRPESLFAVLTDIQHHTVWAEGSIELVSLTDNAVKLGTTWELMCDLLGRRLVTANACNVYEPDHKFGWVTENPITSQTTIALQPGTDSTTLTWIVESEATGIAQLAEPLLVRETKERIVKSLNRLKVYLEVTTPNASTRDAGLPPSYKPGTPPHAPPANTPSTSETR